MKLTPFHLAIPVHDIKLCRKFYKDILGCIEGRSDKDWVDFNFFGHQLVIHYQEKSGNLENVNQVDGKSVPIPHFGLVLEWDTFTNFAKNLKAKGIKFVIEPYIRFEGQAGEQATMFFKDPSGNALEFKSFKDHDQIFAT